MLKERFNFLSFGQKMKDSKYIFDSWLMICMRIWLGSKLAKNRKTMTKLRIWR